MGTTVSELLELKLYQEHATVLSGVGINNAVRYFAVMEAPDFHIETLTRDTFVLTTLSAHYQSLEKINQIVRELCQVGVCAIGIKVGRFVEAVDPSTVDIARDLGIPMLTFGPDVKFREVLSESLGRISDDQSHIIAQINTLNHELFDAILHNRSIRDVLDLLCRKVPCYSCCMDMEGNQMAQANSLDQAPDTAEIQSALVAFYQDWDAGNAQGYLRRGNVVVFPCRAQHALQGVLCIALASNRSELAIPLAEVIVNALSVKFLEHDLRLQAKQELVTSVLDDLLFTRYREESDIRERLNLLNFSPQDHYLLVTILPREAEGLTRGISGTIHTLRGVFEQRFPSALVFVHGSRYVALLGSRQALTEQNVQRIMGLCAETLSESLRQALVLGCSLPFQDLRQLADSYTQAKNAVTYGCALEPGRSLYLYDDCFEMDLIASGLGTPASALFFSRIIDPITEYDRRYNCDLWGTMAARFTHDTLEKVATELFIHISTLRYRLQKIQSLTGCNYFERKGRMTLYMAYLLQKVSRES